MKWIGKMRFVHRDKNGKIIWEGENHNALAQEGQYYLLDVGLRGASQASNFYMGLVNDTPVVTDGLSDLQNEPSGSGYSRQTIEANGTGWPTLALDSSEYQVTSSTETFTASGGSIGPVTNAFLATSSDNTGKLISYVALSETRTLSDGESLEVTYDIKLGNPA